MEKEPSKKPRGGRKSRQETVPQSLDAASLAQLFGGLAGDFALPPRTPVEEAQDIMYDAWEARTPKRAITLAKKALSISADCADAYVVLAKLTAKTPGEAIALYEEGIAAGKRALGPQAFRSLVGEFWLHLETRPFMRAMSGLAETHWETGQLEKAAEVYWEMLRLNPNDNQGVRDMLMPCLIELGRDTDAERLYKKYKEDDMAVWRYSRTLLDFRKGGASARAQRSLSRAVEENKFAPNYLLGRKKLPRTLPPYYGYGDENEAIIYAFESKKTWEATPGALTWLGAALAEFGTLAA